MTGSTEVQKRPYRNQTAGWLGVIKLNHLGASEGAPVAPYGTVWLSDDEAKLTARAPALPKDNPFVEQSFQFYDESGSVVSRDMAPLVLISDDREVPTQERPTPLDAIVDATHAGLRADAEAALADQNPRAQRPVATEAATEPTFAPSSLAAVPPSHTLPGVPPQATAPDPEQDVAERQSWVENAERTEEPQQGSLGGSNDGAPAPPEGEQPPIKQAAPAATTAAQPATPGSQPVPQTVTKVAAAPAQATTKVAPTTPPSESAGVREGAGAPSEEHAAHVPSGEETGAAATPTQPAPKGEFAQAEEVGSPQAPQQPAPAKDGAK